MYVYKNWNPEEVLLDASWSPGPGGLVRQGSMGPDRNNQIDSPWQATTLRALHKRQTEIHPQCPREKDTCTYSGASAWRTGFSSPACPEAMEAPPREGRQGHQPRARPWPHDSSTMLPRKEFTSSPGALILDQSPRNISRSPGLETSGVYDCGPARLYVFAYCKRCCLRLWLPFSLELDAKWGFSSWKIGLDTPSTTGIY